MSEDITKIKFTIQNSTVGDSVKTVAVDRDNIETIEEAPYIKVVCPVTIDKFAGGKITAQGFTDNAGTFGQSRTLNINKYVNSVDTGEYDDSMKAIVNNMKQYSLYAQQFVNETSGLPNLDGDTAIASAAAKYKGSKTDAKSITYKGSQLLLGNAVTLRLVFTGGAPILADSSYDYLGKKYAVRQSQSGEEYYVDIVGIPAFAVLHEFTINYVDSDNFAGKVVYSPAKYLDTIVKGDYNSNEQNLARALYHHYCQ